MRNNQYIISVLSLVLGLLALTSCEANIELKEQPKLKGPIMLSMEDFTSPTKTSVNALSTKWENGDVVNLNGKDYTVVVSGDQASVDEIDITAGAPIFGYYGCSVTEGQLTTTPKVTIPASYKSYFNGDGRQIITLPMAAYTSAASNNITFKHLTAAVEVTIWNATARTLYVDAVTVTAAVSRLNGNLTLDFTAADFGITGDNTSVPEANRTVTVTFPATDRMVILKGETKSVQIPILPMAADNLTINVSGYNADILDASDVSMLPITGLTHVFNHTAPSAALGRNVVLQAKIKMSPQSANVTSKGTFSVSDTKAVYFSKGNLQATATNVTETSADWSWGFAYPQYSYVGGRHSDNTFSPTGNNYVTNQEPWISQNGTVDLFGWVANNYSTTFNGVALYGITANTTTADYGNYPFLKSDWGTLILGDWFTLSKAEWEYLIDSRGTSGHVAISSLTQGTTTTVARYFKATVEDWLGDVCGLVLIPDDFTWPATLEMRAGFVDGEQPIMNNGNANYDYNISEGEWLSLEAAGCVFLPAAGRREGNVIIDDSRTIVPTNASSPYGYYWTSTYGSGDAPYAFIVHNTSSVYVQARFADGKRHVGMSVRLAYPAN